jgi:nicotinamide-nucleotide amidase
MTGVHPPLRRAEIIAVGSEMLQPDRLDTNSLYLTGGLNELGIELRAKAVVGDDLEDIVSLVREAVSRSDLVVLTGGLGPTDDDLTRDAVARALGRGMAEDAPTIERIRERFARRGMRMPDINRRQGLTIEGARLLDNPNGTAPGQWVEDGPRVVLLLPGPPRELKPMFDAVARGLLADRAVAGRLHRRVVRIAGRSESHAEEILQPLYAKWRAARPQVVATILAKFGLLELQLNARTADAEGAARSLQTAVDEVCQAFGADVFSVDGARLEEVVGRLLRERGLRLALAESCTGGLATSRLTDVAGASDYVERAVVAYSNDAKIEVLGVPGELIAESGAVSEPVALAMARGVRRMADVDVGVGITGIAGPGGGSEAKPVGTTAIAVSGPGDRERVRTLVFPGDRQMVKFLASSFAIDAVRRALLG